MLKQINERVDLTNGSILYKLIIFTIPLFLGNLFQQLYSLSDAFIIGNFASNEAFAAVNSTGSIVFLLIGFFNGVAIGASVIISKFVGAKDPKNTKKAIHTVFAFGIAASILATIIGVVLTPFILRWMHTPDNVYPDSFTYLMIYFAGVSTVIMYNVAMGIMRATGDSAHPLYYLIFSSIINIILDLILVAVLHLGVAGAAIATVISQGISAILSIWKLTHQEDEHRLVFKEIQFHKSMLRDTIRIGLPTGVQNSIISIGNIVVQTNINDFQSFAMSGMGAYAKIEGLVFLPIISMSMALTTFISQNLGAKEYHRAKRGAFLGTIISIGAAEIIGVIFFLFAPSLLKIFIDEKEAISFGLIQASIAPLFYFLLAFSHCAAGILRGAGKAIIPMLTMMAFWCVVRVIYVTTAIQFFPKFQTISWAYPLTWALSSIVFFIVLMFTNWIHGLEKNFKLS